jgi:cullin 3
MIAKLKSDSGHQFTSRLEGMFRDMELSKTVMQQWQEGESQQNHGGCELSVSVLTTGFWPLPPVPQCILPQEARVAVDAFKRFYMSQHSGRKLTWQTALGQAELRCTFESGKKELVCHTYQMCILMLFNDGDKLSFAEIQSLTNIPADELTRHLLSLAHPQVKILLKNPPGKACAPDHRFKYNTKYTSKLYRNKISVLSKAAAGIGDAATTSDTGDAAASSASAAASSSGAIPEAVQESRKYSVEASIVRIMKSRKTLDHQLLVSEVIRQLSNKFPVEPQFIKKRIEALIEREYMERDPNNRRTYLYKA